MSETHESTDARTGPVKIQLASGRVVTLRPPSAGELRGVKLLEVLQLDPVAHAAVIERTSDMTAIEFYCLMPWDTMELMGAVANFFAPSTLSPPA